MFLIKIFLIYTWILSAKSDPDLDICKNQSHLDSAVYAPNGNTYLFNGPYYWTAGRLDKQNGITGFANLIKNKWLEVKDPIIGSFALMSKSLLVLVTKSQWFAYENDALVLKGTTADWPQFQDLKIDTMFSIDPKKNRIYVVYADSYRYRIYDFENLFAPQIIHSGITGVSGKFIWFIDEHMNKSSEDLRNLFNVLTSISFDNILMFIRSDRTFCKINLKLGHFEKPCIGNINIKELFGCPLDLSKRKPSTTTKKTTPGTNNPNSVWNSEDSLDFSESSINSLITDINGNIVDSEEDIESDDNTSKIIFAVIMGVIVVIVITVLIAIIVILFGKKSKNKIRKRGASDMASRKSIASVQTITSVDSKDSIASLRDSKT